MADKFGLKIGLENIDQVIEIIKQVESMMVVRNYKGFLND